MPKSRDGRIGKDDREAAGLPPVVSRETERKKEKSSKKRSRVSRRLEETDTRDEQMKVTVQIRYK